MARDVLNVEIDVQRIICHDEGDGWGSAEPYLWTLFFKVDGETIQVNEELTLDGSAVTQTTPGSHGNLPNDDVDAGEVITIPAVLGEWQTVLRPIPTPFPDLVEDVGGVVGVVCVLIEEDNVSDDGAEAGHQAFNDAVAAAIEQIVRTRSFSNQDISEEELAQFEEDVRKAVEEAVKEQQNFFENLWSWINRDDFIGFKVFMFTHDDLAAQGSIDFSQRFANEGDWEIEGNITATVACPAEATKAFFDALFGRDDESHARSLRGMRAFREGLFRQIPELRPWLKGVQRATPSAIRLLRQDQELARQARDVWVRLGEAVGDPDAVLDEKLLDNAAEVVERFRKATRSRRAKTETGRMLDALREVRGRSVAEAAKLLADHPNSRRQPRVPVNR